MTALAALRTAHCWTQQKAAEEWEILWPEQPSAATRFGEWERWPAASGQRPSLATLDRLARLYQCAVADLVADMSDYRHLDPNSRPTDREQAPGYDERAATTFAWTRDGANLSTVASLAEAIGVAASDAGHAALAEQCFQLGLWCAQRPIRTDQSTATGSAVTRRDPDLALRAERLRSQMERSAQLLARDAAQPASQPGQP